MKTVANGGHCRTNTETGTQFTSNSTVGVPLFEKSGRNTSLTCFGEEFLECAQRSLSTLDTGIESLQRAAKGEGIVRLGFLRTLGVDYIPKLTSDFLAADPNSGVQFSFHSDLSSGLINELLRHRFDLVFCSEPDPSLKLSAIPVTTQRLVMIVPNGHPLAERKSINLADTLEYPTVWFAEGSGLRRVIDRMYEQIGGMPVSVIETEEDEVIAGLVAAGFGIAVVPEMDMLRKLDIAVLEITSPPYHRDFFMVQDESVFLSPAAQRFRSFVLGRASVK